MEETLNTNFVRNVTTDYSPLPEEPVFESLISQYERVIVQSIITSFALDFLIKDRHGGDVDTIHNVRQIGIDDQMIYKNKKNAEAYENRGEYDSSSYHSHEGYKAKNAEISKTRKAGNLKDAYTGKRIPGNKPSDLDHVISAKEIHDDRGRVLAGLKGEDLANSPENLQATNPHTNRTKKADSMERFLEKHGDEYTESEKQQMREKDAVARKAYEQKLARAYYTSPAFAADVAKATGNVGFNMGLRQALGLVFTEIWFSVKEELDIAKQQTTFGFADFLSSIGRGVKKGFLKARTNYKELFAKFFEGAIGGVLASLTTTICNIFFTTAKNVVRIIRQSYASLTEAFKVLFINPDNYLIGEKMRAVVKIIATGASVIAGTLVSEAIGKTPIGNLPLGLGEIVQTFCGAFVTGILSCTFLYFIDRSEIFNKLAKWLDSLPSIDKDVRYFKKQAAYFTEYAAKLMDIDIKTFKKETKVFNKIAHKLECANTEKKLNKVLIKGMKAAKINIPWEEYGSFDAFMQDRDSRLVFE